MRANRAGPSKTMRPPNGPAAVAGCTAAATIAAADTTKPTHAEPRSPPGRNSAKSTTSAPIVSRTSGMRKA